MKNEPEYTDVRFSHIMSYAGIGSIVRGEGDKLMTLADTRYWTDRNGDVTAEIIPYVNRVSKALGLNKQLRMPPKATKNNEGDRKKEKKDISGDYLPAILFPAFTKCKKCGLLHHNPWSKQKKDFSEKVFCDRCKGAGKLEQVTWCTVSNKGHLSEVPWHYLCHKNSSSNCKNDPTSNYLELKTSNGKNIIKCNLCGSEGYYEKNKSLKSIDNIQPWIYEGPIFSKEDEVKVEILAINDSRVYMPQCVNALVIPPESRISKTTVVDRLYNNSKLCREIDRIKKPLIKKGKIREVATEFRCSKAEIISALQEIKDGYPLIDEDITIGEQSEDEFKAFLTPLKDVADDEDFVTAHFTNDLSDLNANGFSNNLKAIIAMSSNLIAAKRLREIQVFKGFYRLDSTPEEGTLVLPDIIGESDWLPAIELFGEGIFFTIDEVILSAWESLPAVQKRAGEIRKRYVNSSVTLFEDVEITPRFLLLHTLSHLAIRELESSSGYPAASLKEKVFSSQSRQMAGILIYTAVPDIAGSLGGIIENAEPLHFLTMMDNVFKHASWCSLDPVCSEHEGQGLDWLNRAACHACSLVPETSCNYKNVFLDRTLIKGNKELSIPNFLEFVIQRSTRNE